MTAPKNKYPVSSFGPELMAFLLKAGREKTMLIFKSSSTQEGDKIEWLGDGKKRAHNFHRRIHTLRSKMREEKHEQYPFAARAKVSIFWGADAVREGGPVEWKNDHNGFRGAIIVGRPHDTEFSDVLKEAGIDLNSPTPAPVPLPAPSGPEIITDEAAPRADWLDVIWPEGKGK